MAKKNKSSKPPPDTTTDNVTTEIQQQQQMEDETPVVVELLQVDLGDMVKMKQVLDESVATALIEQCHIQEDHRWDNSKLWLMFVACLFATTAQFAPLPFPESRPILGVCGAAYFVLSGILQLITTFIDRDCIFLSRPSSSSDDQTQQQQLPNKDMYEYGLRVRSNLPRFSEWYTVILEFQIGDKIIREKMAASRVEETWSVGQFFDKEGYFDEVGLALEIEKLLKRFQLAKFDAVGSSDKQKKKKD